MIAPSRSIADFLAEHGVSTPVTVVPTGVDVSCFAGGERVRGRSGLSIPDDVFLAGHVGRLAPEKNLAFLADAFVLFLRRNPKAHVLVVGDGPSRPAMQRTLEMEGMGHRAHFAGVLKGGALADAYAAMDVFAFSSFSETQGLVLVEAMTTGSPVVALDAPGARDVVTDGLNGRLLDADTDVAGFAAALEAVATAGESHRQAMRHGALQTAADYAIDKTVARPRAYYQRILSGDRSRGAEDGGLWARARRSLAREMEILGNFAYAAADAILPDDDGKPGRHG